MVWKVAKISEKKCSEIILRFFYLTLSNEQGFTFPKIRTIYIKIPKEISGIGLQKRI
jgi:hypothetical protein